MEIVIIVAIWSVIVKRGVEDIWHTARGGTPPRLAAAKARRSTGAAGRYWSTLWDDTFDDMLAKHTERRARHQANPSTPRPRGAATQFFAGWFQDGRRAVGRKWAGGWTVLDEKRREKATRPRPGQQTVPGKVVPNRPQDETEDGPQDGDEVRPQDEDGTRPDPEPVPDSGEDEDGIRRCSSCAARLATVGPTCPSCITQQEDEIDRLQHPPDSGPDQDISPTAPPTTQEGTPMTTTIPTDNEVSSLNKAIDYSETTAHVAKEMINSIDFTQANLAAGGVTGIALEEFSTAKESFGTIATAMERAAGEFKAQLAIQEAFIANPGAGTKEFIMGGR